MTKEQVYDQEIYPFMEKVIEICQRERLSIVASFHLGNDLHCTTALVCEDCDPSPVQLVAFKLLYPQTEPAVTVPDTGVVC